MDIEHENLHLLLLKYLTIVRVKVRLFGFCFVFLFVCMFVCVVFFLPIDNRDYILSKRLLSKTKLDSTQCRTAIQNSCTQSLNSCVKTLLELTKALTFASRGLEHHQIDKAFFLELQQHLTISEFLIIRQFYLCTHMVLYRISEFVFVYDMHCKPQQSG